jgi:hypothetical protein
LFDVLYQLKLTKLTSLAMGSIRCMFRAHFYMCVRSCILISPLNIEALDVNIEIGADEPDKNKIISKLVGEEKLNYEVFVENSPETVLPINLDVELVTSSEP